jgi:hypothetical protein
MNQHDNDTIRVTLFPDGRIFQELDDGTMRPLVSRTDWVRVDAMSEEEVEANAMSDPDNPPWTAEDLQGLKPVQNTKSSGAR